MEQQQICIDTAECLDLAAVVLMWRMGESHLAEFCFYASRDILAGNRRVICHWWREAVVMIGECRRALRATDDSQPTARERESQRERIASFIAALLRVALDHTPMTETTPATVGIQSIDADDLAYEVIEEVLSHLDRLAGRFTLASMSDLKGRARTTVDPVARRQDVLETPLAGAVRGLVRYAQTGEGLNGVVDAIRLVHELALTAAVDPERGIDIRRRIDAGPASGKLRLILIAALGRQRLECEKAITLREFAVIAGSHDIERVPILLSAADARALFAKTASSGGS